MTTFNLETACKEALERIHRSNGQRARQAKVRVLDNCATLMMHYEIDGLIEDMKHERQQKLSCDEPALINRVNWTPVE